MNLYESIKSNHTEKKHKSRFIKESAEGGKEFWDKVDAGEIKIGGKLDSDGTGDIDVLDLDKNADYILIKRNSDYQPFVAAWAPEFYNGKLTWGQGHYFDTEDSAREYFNQKALRECDKKEIKESDLGIDKEAFIKKLYATNTPYEVLNLVVTDLPDGDLKDEAISSWVYYKDRNKDMAVYHDLIADLLDTMEMNPNWHKDRVNKEIKEACGKKKRPTLKESNPARYLGIKSVLDEAINHANDDINAKIKEALRSKTAARKYKKDLEDAGIKIDDTPREGVNLIGPNGRMLSADRQNIYGPTKPGHGRTHDDSRYGNSIKSKHKDLASYDNYIARDKENLDKLEKMQRDDVIRAYPNKTSEEAIAAHKKEIENGMTSLARDKKWRKDIEDDIHELRQARDKAHRGTIIPGYSDTTIDREKYYKDPKNKDGRGYSKLVDAIDYKGYLDSKDNNENKDFANGRYRQTPGQKLRNEFKALKQTAEGTYWGAYDARRDLDDKAIDAQAIEKRKKEIEEEYKKKMDDEVNSMLRRKSDADASYNSRKDSYRTRINALKDFRAKHGMEAKDDPDFETYINKKAGRN